MLKRALAAVLSLMLLVGISWAEDRRTDRSVLVIMTLNAEFLWDGVAPEEGQVNFEWKGSQTEAEEHMRRVAEVIIRSNPDIVNLVEVENHQALTTLNDNFLQGRGYKPYFVKGRDTYTGQDVALLTRIDPDGGTIQYDDRKGQAGDIEKSVSKNYVASFTIDNTKICLISLHFLARPLQNSRKLKREAQADAIRSIAVEKADAACELVILGDFNDYDGEYGSRDHISSMPITSVLTIIKRMDPADYADDLVNAASSIPKANRYTAFWDANDNGEIDPPRELTSIDHVLLSPTLAAKLEMADMPHVHDPRFVTDHFPVVVRLRFAQASTGTQAAQVRIVALLPNPDGDEGQNEEVTLKNLGSQPISLSGWKLRDLAGRKWSLDGLGTLQPGQEKTIKRSGQPMALNNGGDTVDLIHPNGSVMQTVTYSAVDEGEVVHPAN